MDQAHIEERKRENERKKVREKGKERDLGRFIKPLGPLWIYVDRKEKYSLI